MCPPKNKLIRVASIESVEDDKAVLDELEEEFKNPTPNTDEDSSVSEDEFTVDSDDPLNCDQIDETQIQKSINALNKAADVIKKEIGKETCKGLSRVFGKILYQMLRNGINEDECFAIFEKHFDVEYVE